MNSDFTSMSHDMHNFLLQKVQNIDDPELAEHRTGTSGRIHQSIHVDKVEQTKACKKLLLGSGDNDGRSHGQVHLSFF